MDCDNRSELEALYEEVRRRAEALGLEQTLAALPCMLRLHAGQVRKGPAAVPYAVHPLTLARHALALGLADDDLTAALLLHDVVEDAGVAPEALPVGERARDAVARVSKNLAAGREDYFARIAACPLACLVKLFDRANNLSGMAEAFSREKMREYLLETERDILPLLAPMRGVPAWRDAAWLLEYQLTGLATTLRRLL